MKIAVIGRVPPPFQGQAIATRIMTELLREIGHEVTLHNDVYRPADDQQVVAGESKLGRASLISGVFRVGASIRAALLRESPDVVIYTGLSATTLGHVRNLVTYALAFRHDTPVIAVVHNGDIFQLGRRSLTAVTWRWLVRRTAALVVLSDRLRGGVERVETQKQVVIANTLDEHFDVAPRPRDSDFDSARPRLLFLGNLIREKGYAEVIDAARELARRGRFPHLRLIGSLPSGAEANDVAGRIEHAKPATIEYSGPVHDRAELRELLLQSDFLLLPSRYRHEALPMVIIEALSSGVPVVASRWGGIPDLVIDGETGFLLDGHTGTDLADAIERVTDVSEWIRLSTGARRHYERAFSRRALSKEWSVLLAGLGEARWKSMSGSATRVPPLD